MKTISWHELLTIGLALSGFTGAAVGEYTELEGGVANGGTLSGRVVFNGTPPPVEILEVDTDAETCGSEHRSEELLVNESGGIQNVVLAIEDITSGKPWDLPQEFVYDQKNCVFTPHVMLIRPKMRGVVLNSDDVTHNVHTVSPGIYNVNRSVRANARMSIKNNKIRRPGTIRVKCDMHYWMKGWWYVAKTPYTVISDGNGQFSITHIPPGTYHLKTWHEKLGESKIPVEIKAGEETAVHVSLTLPDESW